MEFAANLPSPREIKEWIREIEEPFFTGLRRFAHERADYLGYTGCAFTGEELCQDGSFVIHRALMHNFGNRDNTWAWIVYTNVYNLSGDLIPHYWVHFTANDSKRYFIDSTFGQLYPINRIIIGDENQEPFFYGYNLPPQTRDFRETSSTRYLLKFFPELF